MMNAYVTMAIGAARAGIERVVWLQTRLQDLGANYPLLLLHDSDAASVPLIKEVKLRREVPFVLFVNRSHGRRLLKAGDQLRTMQKFHIFNLVEFARVVYIDQDIYLRTLPDPLFAVRLNDTHSVAAVDVGGCFNSGLMVVRPSAHVYNYVREVARKHVWHLPRCEFYRGDQTALNIAFPKYVRLPAQWNWCHHLQKEPIRAPVGYNVHFVGRNKPTDMCTANSLLSQS